MRRLLVLLTLVAAVLAVPSAALATTSPTIATVSPTNLAPTLTWADVADATAGYHVFRGDSDCAGTLVTPAGGDFAPGSATPYSFTDNAPVPPDGTYCYFVRADDGVTTADSNQVIVKLDTTPPTITGVTKTGGDGCLDFTLQSASNNPDASPPVTFFADGHPLPWTPTGAEFDSVTPGVTAVDALGNVTPVPFVVPGIVHDTTRPPAPVLEVNTDPAQQKATLNWSVVTSDGAPVLSYHLHTKGPKGNGDLTTASTTPIVFSNLQVDATYEYTLYATDVCGDGAGSIRLVRLNDTDPPSAPIVAGPAFDPATHVVQLAWVAATDNIQVDHYEILRNGVPIGATDTTTYTDALPGEHAVLSYVVRAVDTNGNETDSAPALITTPDWTSPTAPVLTATTQGTTATLRWSAAADNVGVVGYDVLRDGKQVASTLATERTYSDRGLKLGSHTWQVRAHDAAGLSAMSAPQTRVIKKAVVKADLVSVHSTSKGRGTARYSLGGPTRMLLDIHVVGTLQKAKLRLYVQTGRGRITVWRGTPGSSAPRLLLGSALVRHGYVNIPIARAMHTGRVRLVLIARGHVVVAATGAHAPKMQVG